MNPAQSVSPQNKSGVNLPSRKVLASVLILGSIGGAIALNTQLGANTALFAIGIYRKTLSPAIARTGLARCRFQPTCSQYADTAIRRYGLYGGTKLTISRLLRCNPWGGSGDDPVPEPVQVRAATVAAK